MEEHVQPVGQRELVEVYPGNLRTTGGLPGGIWAHRLTVLSLVIIVKVIPRVTWQTLNLRYAVASIQA
jgi:hypothetical protein